MYLHKRIQSFVGAMLVIFVYSCSTVKPPKATFYSNPQEITNGQSTFLVWEVQNAENTLIQILENGIIIDSKKNITGSISENKSVKPNKTTNYELKILRDDIIVERKTATVIVKMPPPKDTLPPPKPIVEEKNSTESRYLKGTVNYQNVKDKSQLRVAINTIDIHGFPKQVRLYCTVQDQFGNHVANLAPPYNYQNKTFWKSIIEQRKDKLETISSFTVEEVRSEDAPAFASVLVADYSGSMVNDIDNLEKALQTSVQYIRPAKDFYSVIQFDHRIYQSVDFTQNPKNISSIIPFSSLGKITAFYSAAKLSLQTLSNSPDIQKVAILFTDGIDNASLLDNADDIVNEARQENIKVFIIGYAAADKRILESIAQQTGGKSYFPASSDELPNIYEDIYRFLKVHYIITYTTTKSTLRTDVTLVTLPDATKELKTMKSYFPEPQQIEEKRRYEIAIFKPNSSATEEGFDETFMLIAKILNDKPDKMIEIYAHTDSRGSASANKALSQKRAQYVANILIKKGVSPKRIRKIEGKGEENLYHKNDEKTPWMQRENRRCEISFI